MLELLSLFSCSARTPILILPQLAGHIFLSSFSTQTPILIQLQRSNTFSYSAAWRLDPFPYLAAALGHLFLFSRRPLDTYSYSATAVLGHLSLFRRSAQTPILFSLIVLDIDSYSAIVLDIYSYSHLQCLDPYPYSAAALGHLFYSASSCWTSILIQPSCWTPILIQPHRAGHLFLFSRIVLDIYSYPAASCWTSILIQPQSADPLFI